MEKKENNNVFVIVDNKTIPINKKEIYFSTKEGILFDNEIIINVDGIYDNNRLRLIIHEEEDIVDIFTASYQKRAGLCYHNFTLMKDEYSDFQDINDFVKKVLIEGQYMERGINMIMSISKTKANNLLKEDEEYIIDI